MDLFYACNLVCATAMTSFHAKSALAKGLARFRLFLFAGTILILALAEFGRAEMRVVCRDKAMLSLFTKLPNDMI